MSSNQQSIPVFVVFPQGERSLVVAVDRIIAIRPRYDESEVLFDTPDGVMTERIDLAADVAQACILGAQLDSLGAVALVAIDVMRKAQGR